MRLLGAIRSTARVSDNLFRHAFPLYALLYERYKRAAERDVIACIRRLVRPGDRVVDVGANIGFYAALLGLLDEWGFRVHRLAAGGALGERLTPDLPIAGADDENHYFDVLCVRPAAAGE